MVSVCGRGAAMDTVELPRAFVFSRTLVCDDRNASKFEGPVNRAARNVPF